MIGWTGRAAVTLQEVLKIYPDELEIWNKLGVMKLIAGRNDEARGIFQEVLTVCARLYNCVACTLILLLSVTDIFNCAHEFHV